MGYVIGDATTNSQKLWLQPDGVWRFGSRLSMNGVAGWGAKEFPGMFPVK
jgi:hypothetical protein